MATTIPNSSTTVGDNLSFGANIDAYIRESVLIASTSGTAIVAALGSHAITVLGKVYGDTAGVELGIGPTSFSFSRLSIGPGGTVAGRSVGVETTSSSISINNGGLIDGNK
jgi:hypothetical protein